MPTEMAATTKPPLQPLVPRIDRLDSIMKILEEQKSVAMDMAVREAQLKGSLMDRVRSLRNRLLQLCLEIESRGTTSLQDTSVFQVLKDATSNRGRGGHNKGKTKSEQREPRNEADDPRKNPTRSGKVQKSVATKKKAKHSTWFHLKLLGC